MEGMRFYAYHGCFEEERRVGTRFELSCELEYDASAAEETDDLSKAIDYQQVYAIIKQEKQIPVVCKDAGLSRNQWNHINAYEYAYGNRK